VSGITRKFYWYGDRRWIVYCLGDQLVAISEFEIAQEIAA
jgi:hypothetical protein